MRKIKILLMFTVLALLAGCGSKQTAADTPTPTATPTPKASSEIKVKTVDEIKAAAYAVNDLDFLKYLDAAFPVKIEGSGYTVYLPAEEIECL